MKPRRGPERICGSACLLMRSRRRSILSLTRKPKHKEKCRADEHGVANDVATIDRLRYLMHRQMLLHCPPHARCRFLPERFSCSLTWLHRNRALTIFRDAPTPPPLTNPNQAPDIRRCKGGYHAHRTFRNFYRCFSLFHIFEDQYFSASCG